MMMSKHNNSSEIDKMLNNLEPVLNEGRYAFVSLPDNIKLDNTNITAFIREDEGSSIIMNEELAVSNGCKILFSAAWITLKVHSDLNSTGLTAAVSTALAESRIACNMVAGAFHDHLFVPYDKAGEALSIIQNLKYNYKNPV